MHKQRQQVAVHEEVVEPVIQPVRLGRRWLEEGGEDVERAIVEVFASVLHLLLDFIKGDVSFIGLPHLQQIDHLPDVPPDHLYHLFDGRLVHPQTFSASDGQHSGCNLLFCGPAPHERLAVVLEAANLGVASIITDTDDGDFGIFDDVDQGLDASSVRIAAHAVHFIHHQHLLAGAGLAPAPAAAEELPDAPAVGQLANLVL
mmetsp:Transcript_30018/g.58806  ORF Transcript_30018/g.58806 Transcript_30018/m.58806 type:complete len:202 (+) Transcript_30018:824-1429(+)